MPTIMPLTHKPGGTIPQDAPIPAEHPTLPKDPSKTILLTVTPSMNTDTYTIRAVGQEEFSDVKVPDAPAQKLPAQK